MSFTLEEILQDRVYGDDPRLVEDFLRNNQIDQAILDQMLLMSLELCSNATTMKLLEWHADPTIHDYLPFRDAAKKNRKDVVEMLLPYCDYIPPEIQLIIYSGLGEIEKIRLLLNKNININISEGEALIIAIKNNHIDIVKILFENCINLNNCIDRALETAIEVKNYEMVLYLLDRGADPTIKSGSLLKMAYNSRSLDIVNLFINRNYHFSDEVMLSIYSSMGSYEQVQELLQKGVDIHHNNDEALDNAITMNHLNIVNLLLLYGANIHLSEDWPITHSIIRQNKDLFQLLRTHGANIPSRLINQTNNLE